MSATPSLRPSATSLAARLPWISWSVFGVAFSIWMGLASSTTSWVTGTLLALIIGGALLQQSRQWHLARPLRTRVQVRSASLRLLRDQARIETYGIQERETKTWSTEFEVELCTLQDLSLEAAEPLICAGTTRIPDDQPASGEWVRWWAVVEVSLEDCPPYSATFPIRVTPSRG